MQCQFVVSKATKHLNHSRQTTGCMFGCTQEAKANTYKALVRPFLNFLVLLFSTGF